MDPVSAVLAFTGLSASLITIVDTIFELSKKMHELQKKFKHAPRKILQLHQDLQNLRALVMAIQARFSSDEAINYPSALRAVCESFIVQLERDLQELENIVDRSNSKLNFPAGKVFKERVQHVLAESTINEFHSRISTHIGYMIMVQTLMNK